MVERTIRSLAKDLAGQFYEQRRSDRFRSGNELVKAHTVGVDPFTGKHVEVPVKVPFNVAYPDAKTYVAAFWPYYVDAARQCLTAMLGMPDSRISAKMKREIFDAIKEDRQKQDVLQRQRIDIPDLIGQRAPDR